MKSGVIEKSKLCDERKRNKEDLNDERKKRRISDEREK